MRPSEPTAVNLAYLGGAGLIIGMLTLGVGLLRATKRLTRAVLASLSIRRAVSRFFSAEDDLVTIP